MEPTYGRVIMVDVSMLVDKVLASDRFRRTLSGTLACRQLQTRSPALHPLDRLRCIDQVGRTVDFKVERQA